ncbi:MAG: RNA methyltransferase [Thermoleophilia bacterium]|nr:RNA methyltransferase [Thermoleophilia bacterium]
MITSSQNEQIKELRKLHDKKQRARHERFVAEGEDLVRAALDADWQPTKLFCTPAAPADLAERAGAERVDPSVLDSASALGSGSRVIGVFEQRLTSLDAEFQLAVYLDAISDPGNIGSALRSALAFADGPVILGPGCADPFSPKAVRASMGALFARPPARATAAELSALPVRRVALDGGAASELRALSKGQPTVLCVGSEREGLSGDVLAAADECAAIRINPDGPQSLNAAVAASIALYEFAEAMQSAVHEVSAGGAATGNAGLTEK